MKTLLVLLFVAVCFLFGPVSSVDSEEAKGAEINFDRQWVPIWCPAGTVNVGKPAPLESGNVLCLTNQITEQACTTFKTTDSESKTSYGCLGLSKCTGDEYPENGNCMSPLQRSLIKCCCKEENCKNAIFTAPEPTTTTSTDSAEIIVTVDGEETPSSTTNDAQQENETTALASTELTKEDSTTTDSEITRDTGEELATTAFETIKAEETITTTYEKPTTTEIYTSTTIIPTGKLTTITTTAKPTTTAEKPTTKIEKPAITIETPTTTTTTDTESATESTASATEEEAATVEKFSATADNSKIDANVTAATPPSHKAQKGNWLLYVGVSLGVLALVGAVGAGVFIFFQRKKKRDALKRQAEKCSIRASVDSTFEPLSAFHTRAQ